MNLALPVRQGHVRLLARRANDPHPTEPGQPKRSMDASDSSRAVAADALSAVVRRHLEGLRPEPVSPEGWRGYLLHLVEVLDGLCLVGERPSSEALAHYLAAERGWSDGAVRRAVFAWEVVQALWASHQLRQIS